MSFGLTESCLQYEGQLLYFNTHYGWGWGRMEEDAPSHSEEEVVTPPSFHVRVRYFYKHNDVLRGAVMVIEEEGHKYNGFWSVFYTRGGECDLTEKLVLNGILIGPDEPVKKPWGDPKRDKLWPHWEFSLSPQIAGYGMIAASKEHIETYSKTPHSAS